MNHDLNKIAKREYYLVFTRDMWIVFRENDTGFNFSDEELDKAEKKEDGLIGNAKGVNCYLQKPLKYEIL